MRPQALRALGVSLSILAMIGLGACEPPRPEPETPPVEPGLAPAAGAGVSYACETGQTVRVAYSGQDAAQVIYNNNTYDLRIAPAASGARYTGSGVEWWTATRDGQETATLSRLGPNQDVGVAVLERCSRPSAAPAPGATGEITGGTLPPPVAGPQPANAPCRGPQLRLIAGEGDAGAGNRGLRIAAQNLGTVPCTLRGYPGLVLQDAQGRNISTVRTDQQPDGDAEPALVTLAPQGRAWFDLMWNVVPHEGEGERVCPSAARIRATTPGDTSPVSLDQQLTPCGGRVRVSAFRAAEDPDAAPPAAASAAPAKKR